MSRSPVPAACLSCSSSCAGVKGATGLIDFLSAMPNGLLSSDGAWITLGTFTVLCFLVVPTALPVSCKVQFRSACTCVTNSNTDTWPSPLTSMVFMNSADETAPSPSVSTFFSTAATRLAGNVSPSSEINNSVSRSLFSSSNSLKMFRLVSPSAAASVSQVGACGTTAAVFT